VGRPGKGFFARNGLQALLIATTNSVEQMTGLIDGQFGIAMTAVDNVIAYMEGQGEAPTRSPPDIVAVMGSSSGFLSLITAPEIKSLADLRGTTLSVDAMTTGYAFTLRRMLEKAGLKDGDYTLTRVGGMKERYEARMEYLQRFALVVGIVEPIERRDVAANEADELVTTLCRPRATRSRHAALEVAERRQRGG
jgi:ABC-type nitrate/sulfonate/bicarbonate transport system substrate-binding protein